MSLLYSTVEFDHNASLRVHLSLIYYYKEFEDTRGVIRIRKSKTDRQYNGQKKKDKRTNNDLQNINNNPKIE
jgi:hypothetical protein